MNSVAPSRRPRALAWRASAAGSSTDRVAPRKLCTAGRGRSVGSFKRGGSPASCRRQKVISLLQDLAVQPGTLPDREIRILHRQLGEGRRPARDERRIERRNLAHQDAHGPAVADDVVHGQQDDVIIFSEAQQHAAQQRPAR